MKIALFTQTIERGAFAAAFSGLSYALDANGIKEIHVLSVVGSPSISTNSFPSTVRHIQLSGGRVAYSAFWLRRYLPENSPDVLITAR